MKKILTKIIGASLAIAMMIGVGIGVNVNKTAKPVNAETATVNATTYSNGNITGTGVTWTGNGVGGTNYVVLKSGASLTSNGFSDIDLAESVSFTINTRTFGGASYKTSTVRAYSNAACTNDITNSAATVNASGSSFGAKTATLTFATNATAENIYFKITSSTTSNANGPGINQISFTYTKAENGGQNEDELTLNKVSLSLDEGEEFQLVATLPDGVSDPVTWASDNEDAAEVSDTGLVTAIERGQATITATAGSLSAECVVTVNGPIRATVSEALTAAGQLASGATTQDQYLIEGYITEIRDAWSAQHSNLGYNLGATADDQNPIYVYRSGVATGTTGPDLKPTDRVKVLGKLKNYSGTLEVVEGTTTLLEAGEGPSAQDVNDVDAESTDKTVAQIYAYQSANNTLIAKVTGVAENNFGQAQYGNFYLANPSTGEAIVVYGGYTDATFQKLGDVYSTKTKTTAITDAIIGHQVTVYGTIGVGDGHGRLVDALVVVGNVCTATVSASVIVNDNQMGTATLSETSVAYGTEITVNPVPAQGYRVASITVQRASKQDTLTANQGVYSFNAEAKNAVTVTFEEDPNAGEQIVYQKIASYDFSEDNTSSATAEYNASGLLTRFGTACQSGTGLSNIVTAISSTSKVYAGQANYISLGLKFGTSSANGSFTTTLNQSVIRVVIKTAAWSDSDTIKVGNAAAQTPGVAYTSENSMKTLTYNITSSSSVTFLYAKRGYIQSIDFFVEGQTSDDPADYLESVTSKPTLHGTENSVYSSLNFENAGLSNEATLTSFDIGPVSLAFAKGSGNAPKFYTSDNSARAYNGNTLTFSYTGKIITRIEFAFVGTYSSGLATATGAYENGVWNGSADSIVFTNTGSVRIASIAVTYFNDAVSVNPVAIRFGTVMPKTTWDAFATSGFTIEDYGIMLFKTDTLDGLSSTPVADIFNNPLLGISKLAVARKNSGDAPQEVGDNYVFTAKVTVSTRDLYFCAASFVVIDDHYYFFNEQQESVNSLASYYRSNGGSDLSYAALTSLMA